MKILVADHDPAARQALCALLDADHHELTQAATGDDVLARFAAQPPDLVLLGTALPEEDGYRCAQRIAARIAASGGGHFVPVMLVASAAAPLELDRFIECGAADFIHNADAPTVVRARIAGYRRMRDIYLRIDRAQSHLRQEVKLARHMFNSVIGRSPADPGNLRHWMVSAGHFSGDLLVHEYTPGGDQHVLLCDFTGHGLSAAVGALPTSDVFFAMTRKGCTLAEIAAEINRKLNRLMPTGQFCAAILARLSPAHDALEIWNGGQPPVLMLDAEGRPAGEAASAHFPLGVMPPARFDARTETHVLHGIRHIVLYSDGLVEARNPRGDMFGTQRLHQALSQAQGHAPRQSGSGGSHLLHVIKSHVVAFLDGLEPHDDVSLLTLDIAAGNAR